MRILRAYHNRDAISCYYEFGEIETNIGQVEIYEHDTETGGEDIFDNSDYESYMTEEEIEARVNEINSHEYTWATI